MDTILIIDDEPTNAKYLSFILKKNGYQTRLSYTGDKGVKIFKKDVIDIVFCDFQLTDSNGSKVLKKIKKINPDTPVIIFTGYADVKTAVNVMKLGAFDYLIKPLVPEEVLMVVDKAKERVTTLSSNNNKNDSSQRNVDSNNVGAVIISDESDYNKKFIVGESSESINIQKQIQLVAKTNYSVIIYGESGTGKESIAHSVHQHSKRKEGPFIALDCGALVKDLSGSELFGHEKGAFTGASTAKAGQFELADGGTVFLDEIGNLSYDIQTSLLRVIQERKIRRLGSQKEISIDVRIIVASNKNLETLVEEGQFREDLYHRLNQFSIILQPLSERIKDFSLFASHFLKLVNIELDKHIKGISNEAYDILIHHNWPGNLRELNNVIRRAALLSENEIIMPESLPPELILHSNKNLSSNNKSQNSKFLDVDNQEDLKSTSDRIQEFKIVQTLKMTNNNKSEAARILGIDRKTLYNKLHEYDIEL